MLDINFNQIIEMIEKRKNNAYRKVNEEIILLYLEALDRDVKNEKFDR